MPGDVSLRAFPANRAEGLAMLWVKQNAEKAETPQDLCRMYFEAYYQILGCSDAEAKRAEEITAD